LKGFNTAMMVGTKGCDESHIDDPLGTADCQPGGKAMAKSRIVSRSEQELSILCEDRPGMLSQLAKHLGKGRVNILATSAAPSGMQTAVRVIVDYPARAKKILDREHIPYTEHEVLYVELPNLPGALSEFAGKLAAENINITTAYGSSTPGSKKAVMIFRVSNLDKALSVR
jgi:hypothetical protein